MIDTEDVQDIAGFGRNPVDNHIWQANDNNLAGPGHQTFGGRVWEIRAAIQPSRECAE
jgi:hypothetical protein